MAILRGIKGWQPHSPLEFFTGFAGTGVARRPAFGWIVSRLTGGNRDGFPCYVTLNYASAPDPEEPCYAGAAHKPFRFTDNRGMANLSLPYGMTLPRLRSVNNC